MWAWVLMNRARSKGIVRIHRFHFDHDECLADAAFLVLVSKETVGEAGLTSEVL